MAEPTKFTYSVELNIDEMVNVADLKTAQLGLIQFLQLARTLDGSSRDALLQKVLDEGNEVLINFKALRDELEDFLHVS